MTQEEIMPKKQCTICKEPKLLKMFYRKKCASDGRMPECITCRAVIYTTNRDKRKKEREFLNQFI